MSLESTYFKVDFFYNSPLVEKYVKIIQTSKRPKRVRAFKNLVFMMMSDIVKKNIANYINLLRNSDVEYLPERDELVADCYLIFDKCVYKFILGRGYNFYFYYNKSLSRNFFRNYQKEIKHNNCTTEITDVMTIVSPSFRSSEESGSVDLLMDQLGFNELEKRVCKSRVVGQKTSEFLKSNPGVTNSQYSGTLKVVKEKLNTSKENKDI